MTTMDFKEMMDKLKHEHAEELQNMPLPEGVAEYVSDRVAVADSETLVFMIKLAWMFGAQTGYAATKIQVTPVSKAQA